MTEPKCFICNSGSPPNPNSSDILAHQLNAIFLLRNVFELPSWILQKYLVSSGGGQNPSQWLSVCTECDPFVRKTRTFYDQFLEADRKFRRAKYELVRKIKESLSPGFTNCGSISEECRQLVQLHDYAEPPKNPFRAGDHRARELLGVAVDFDVAKLNVKMEAFESTEENHLDLNLVNVTFDHQHHTDIDLGCSQDLSLTPEGHDYDYSDGGGDYYGNIDDDEDDDDDYAYLPPGPKSRKIEAAAKYETPHSSTKTKTDPETRNDEISATEASSLIHFMTTSHGKRMVRYDGHDFFHSCYKPSSTGMTIFNCKWRPDGCPVRIGLRNYNEEDATFTGFLPNLDPHDHSAARIGPGHTKHAIWFEVNSLAKGIVKDNVNLPTGQVLKMVLDSFMGDPEVSEELKKKNVHRNLSRVICNMKRRLGGTGRRRFVGAKMKSGESDGDVKDGNESHPELKTDLVPSQTDVGELTFDQSSALIQFLTTSHGKRMMRYDGHNFYNTCLKPSSSGVTVFYCKWRRDGCLARIRLRNYNEEDATFSGFMPNSQPHQHSANRNEQDMAKQSISYEVNPLAKEIVKDNINAPVDQVIQMVQDSFMGDPEVTEELSKESVQKNLARLIRNTKRKLGWKPDRARRSFVRPKIQIDGHDEVTEQALVPSHPELESDLIPSQKDLGELASPQASSLIQFLTTSHGKRMVRYDGHNFYNTGLKPSSSGMIYFYCKWRRHGCLARIGLRNYNQEDATFSGFLPNSQPHDHSANRNEQDRTKHAIWYEVNPLAKEIVKDNINAPVDQVMQMVQDSFMGDPEVSEELCKENVQSNLRKVIRNMKRRLGWKPEPKAKGKRTRKKTTQAVATVNVNTDDNF